MLNEVDILKKQILNVLYDFAGEVEPVIHERDFEELAEAILNNAELMDDYQISDDPCPKCEHDITHWRLCDNLDCDDGYCDAHERDPVNYMPGEIEYLCHTCKGTDVVSWCPSCGANLTKYPGKEPGERR